MPNDPTYAKGPVMTIADRINEYAEKEGITPVTGSIVDVLNNVIAAKGGTPTGGTIADAMDKFNQLSSEEEPVNEDS